jgi:tRNA modification GTPase
LVALSEVSIDFSDQDLDATQGMGLDLNKKKLQDIYTKFENLKNTYRRGIYLQEGIQLALVGLPNAGKSSFFNALLGEDRALVSNIPGTTRDLIKEKLTDIVVRFSMFDKFTKGDKTSYAFRLVFQANDRTLTEEEINAVMNPVYEILKMQAGFEIR